MRTRSPDAQLHPNDITVPHRRPFTPSTEIDRLGHAPLASSMILPVVGLPRPARLAEDRRVSERHSFFLLDRDWREWFLCAPSASNHDLRCIHACLKLRRDLQFAVGFFQVGDEGLVARITSREGGITSSYTYLSLTVRRLCDL